MRPLAHLPCQGRDFGDELAFLGEARRILRAGDRKHALRVGGLRLGKDPGFQPGDHRVVEVVAPLRELTLREGHGQPKLCLRGVGEAAQREAEGGGHHADHRVGHAVEGDAPAESRAGVPEEATRQPLSEHGDPMGPEVFLGGEGSAHEGSSPQEGKKRGRYAGRVHPEGFPDARQVVGLAGESGHR